MQPLRSKSNPAPWAGIIFGIIFLTIWFWTPITNTIGEWFADSAVTVQKPYSFELQGSKLGMCLSPDGHFLATAGERSFALWDIHSRKIVTRITLDRDIEWIKYSNDGRSLIMKTDDSVKLWDTKKWTVLKSYDPKEFLHLGELIQLTAASGNELIGVLMSSDKQYTTIYDIASAKKLLQLDREFRGQIGFDSSSKHLAAYSRHPSRLVLWDLTSGIEEDTIPADEFTGGLRVSPNGRFVAWNTRGRVVVFDRLIRLAHTIYYEMPYQETALTAFSPDSGKIAVTHRDGIKLYDTTTGKLLSRLASSAFDYRSLDFSLNGHSVAVNYEFSSAVDIWDIRNI
jgi:WD40 repeat protein